MTTKRKNETNEEYRKRTKEYMKIWRKNNKEHLEEWWNDYYKKNRKRKIKISKDWYLKNKDRHLKNSKIRREKIRFEILTHYGGNPPKCACCGETFYEFLTIDHINGGGNKQMKQLGSPNNFYKWIIQNNFPEGFRILCMNCNFALGHYGYCPHNKRKN